MSFPKTLKEIEAALALSGSPYIQGDTPSNLDTQAFGALKGGELDKLTSADYPSTFAWYSLVSCFNETMIAGFGKPGPAVKVQKSAAGGEEKKKSDQPKEKKEKGKKEKKEEKKGGPKQPTAKELRLLKKQEEAAAEAAKKDPNDPCAAKFGDRELNRSQGDPEIRFTKKFTKVVDLNEDLVGQVVIVRSRLHNSRVKGKAGFFELRDQTATVQSAMFVGGEGEELISKGMVSWSGKVPKESIVEVKAKVAKPEQDTKCTQSKVELQVLEFWCLNRSAPVLPFQIEDASRLVTDQTAEAGVEEGVEKADEGEKQAVVRQDVRLNNRIIDLRVPTNFALMKLQAGMAQLFREFMYKNGFTEIHSPKLIGGASEGGANVFHLKYFDQPACLAQSPQLYKQMALCADMERVFEIGPVFRAENSNTNRHLCEFTGLDMEMVIKEHYFEVLDLLGDMFIYIFKNAETRFAKELETIKAQYPFEPFVCKTDDKGRAIKIHFKDGVKMLKEAGVAQEPLEDLSTETEKALGRLVKKAYGTDFYMLYGYPANARPFYTMLDPTDSNYTNSYDFFMRGEEITSGAQRIHDPAMLTERAQHFEIPVETIKDYVDSFSYGAPAHGGCGIGLERVVKFYCNVWNIRKTSLFPRDPKRIAP